MKRMVIPLRARPRLVSAMVTGVLAAALIPTSLGLVTRALLGWNVAVWLYLGLEVLMMARADHLRLRRVAAAQAEGAPVVLIGIVLASLVSLAGIVAELSAAKLPEAHHAWPHLLFALFTVVGSWLLVPMNFALSYASAFYQPGGHGLKFPDADPRFEPHYIDFLYFSLGRSRTVSSTSFTIAVASQTADISVVSSAMRRLVLLHCLVSFAFNTAILAFTINVAASMF